MHSYLKILSAHTSDMDMPESIVKDVLIKIILNTTSWLLIDFYFPTVNSNCLNGGAQIINYNWTHNSAVCRPLRTQESAAVLPPTQLHTQEIMASNFSWTEYILSLITYHQSIITVQRRHSSIRGF